MNERTEIAMHFMAAMFPAMSKKKGYPNTKAVAEFMAKNAFILADGLIAEGQRRDKEDEGEVNDCPLCDFELPDHAPDCSEARSAERAVGIPPRVPF